MIATLVDGLVLGYLSRTGRVTWQIGHGANVVLRQLGILMFLACAGLGSGTAFADAVVTRRGLELAGAGIVVALAFAATIPLATELALRRNIVDSAGMLAGIETQPAALAYINERTSGDERVNQAYALVFPWRWSSRSSSSSFSPDCVASIHGARRRTRQQGHVEDSQRARARRFPVG